MLRFRKRLVPVLLNVVALSIFSVPVTAAAGGAPYSPTTWAGVRVTEWNANDGWRVPRVVQARWQIPCLPTTADGIYGAYDQWIGIEDWNGTSLLQVGVRSYHLAVWGGQVITGYFAWVANTNDPNARTPVPAFRIARCGFGETNPVVTAEVNAAGRATISAVHTATDTDPGQPGVQEPRPYTYFAPAGTQIGAPRYGSFMVERFSLNQYLPPFGRARFLEAWAGGFVNGYLGGWHIGSSTDYVHQHFYYMLRRQYQNAPPPPWIGWGAYAVVPWGSDQYGNFDLRQLAVD